MRKVGSTTDTADANGEYTNGNVAQGIPPTIINAEMLNTFQRELIGVVESAGIPLDPTDDNQVVKAINKIVGGGRLLNVKTFTVSGTYTPTPGTKLVIVEAVGGGGGGGGCSTPGTGMVSAAAGGNAGSYGRGMFAISGSVPVTIGSGGEGGISSTTPTGATVGKPGGDTEFGTFMICPGGLSGLAANSFTIPNICQSIPPKSNPTVGANISSIDGEPGGNGLAMTTGISGKGGGNPLGSGGAPAGATGGSSVVGNNGSGFGSGGSGAFAGSLASGKNGGAGAPGVVIVWEYT
ncbi:phage tail protein [Serratia sp. JSRIV002]|uniref:phage tail protein n=1 Tax=Serratia sp. JSRIV002 TaxID=2831894 RepID=UPI001CBB7B1E|nr:phage tail protein [Serratia sp. JSRIV002]UAN52928.1 phage tail protein [Serratia sp. JSRIV002]